MYCIQHCFTCRPSDSAVSKDAVIEPRTVATSALAVRRSNHSARSHPPEYLKAYLRRSVIQTVRILQHEKKIRSPKGV
jgi:hypothetical protein